MEDYNNFIELLKGFDSGRSFERVDEWGNEVDENGTAIDTYSYNGFLCDRIEDIDIYEEHLKSLYKIAFTDIKKAVDGLLINSNNPSLLDIFFQSKIDDLTEIEKRIEERNDEITEAKINFGVLIGKGAENEDELMTSLFEDWYSYKKGEELYYRGDIDKFELAESGVPLIDRIGVRRFAPIIMEKLQRDMVKTTANRLNEIYGIYCPKTLEVEAVQKKTIKSQVKKDFRSYLHHNNKDAIMEKLHELLDGEKGKVVAITIKALEKLGFMGVLSQRTTLYKSMENEFGNIGAHQGLNDFYIKLNDENPLNHAILKNELQLQIDILSKVK